MFIANQRFDFTPPGGGPAIRVLGGQEFSPGTHHSNVWRFLVPHEHAERMSGRPEYGSFSEATRALAHAFFDGDEAKVAACLVSLDRD